MSDASAREPREGPEEIHTDTYQVEDDGEASEDEFIKQEEVDPRVQGELDTLNTASDEINTLETELEKARNKFRTMLADSTQRLNQTFKKLGKVVLKARPYYESLKQSKQAQAEAQKAAVHFQRANSVYQSAKEMVQLAEERNFPEDGDRRAFDSAWQEMLNHATIKFMQSEKEKTDSEEEHLKKAAEYGKIQQNVRFHEKDMPRNISKAKPYFELKDKLEHHLQLERIQVEDLQMGLVCAKHKYRQTLNNLEAISEEIHQKRKKRLELPPRTPGVGAESMSDLISLPSVNLDNLSDTTSFASLDLDADGASIKEDIPDYEKLGPSPKELSNQLAIQTEKPIMDINCEKVDVNKSIDVNDKLGQVCIGRREAIAEGSESVENTSTVESPEKPPVVNFTSVYHNIAKPSTTLSPSYVASTYARVKVTPSRKQQKIQTQMAFPILQGLSQTHQRLSPGLRVQKPSMQGGYVQAHRAPMPGGYVQAHRATVTGAFQHSRPVNPHALQPAHYHSPGGQIHSPGFQQKYSPGGRSYSSAGVAVAQEEDDQSEQTQDRKKKVEVFV